MVSIHFIDSFSYKIEIRKMFEKSDVLFFHDKNKLYICNIKYFKS